MPRYRCGNAIIEQSLRKPRRDLVFRKQEV